MQGQAAHRERRRRNRLTRALGVGEDDDGRGRARRRSQQRSPALAEAARFADHEHVAVAVDLAPRAGEQQRRIGRIEQQLAVDDEHAAPAVARQAGRELVRLAPRAAVERQQRIAVVPLSPARIGAMQANASPQRARQDTRAAEPQPVGLGSAVEPRRQAGCEPNHVGRRRHPARADDDQRMTPQRARGRQRRVDLRAHDRAQPLDGGPAELTHLVGRGQ